MMYLSLCGEPSTFMRLISEVNNSLTNVFAYLDDAIIYSESEEDHQKRLQVIFQRLYDYRLPLNSKKYIFVKKELDVVGNNITQDEFQPL